MVIFLLLTFSDTIGAYRMAPPNTTVTYVHNHPQDYFYNLHVMQQGYEGAWKIVTRMTPESFPPQFAHLFFVVLGKVGRIVPLGMGELYTVARLTGSIALMLVMYRLVVALFPAHPMRRVGAFAVTLAGTYWPIIENGTMKAPILMNSIWTELDPMVRLSFIPHHLWSKVCFLVLLLLFLALRKDKRRFGSLWVASFLIAGITLLMGFMSPIIIVTYVGVMSLWFSFEWIVAIVSRKSIPWYLMAPAISTAVAVGYVVWYHWNLAHSTFPWTTYGPPWETNWLYLISPGMYLQSFGPLFFVAIVGAVGMFRKNPLVRLLTAWVLAGWVFIFILRSHLPFSNSRYFSGYQWIAVNLLAVMGFVWIADFVRAKFKIQLFGICIILALLLSAPAWYASVADEAYNTSLNVQNPQHFLSPEIRGVLTYLASLPAGTCVVAAPDWFDTMIPAYTSCRSVSGHKLMTWANDVKVYEMNEFFFSQVSLDQKAKRLAQYHVTHVITLDGITGTDILPLLQDTPEFVARGVRVYRVR